VIDVRDGVRDVVDCGPGKDDVVRADRIYVLATASRLALVPPGFLACTLIAVACAVAACGGEDDGAERAKPVAPTPDQAADSAAPDREERSEEEGDENEREDRTERGSRDPSRFGREARRSFRQARAQSKDRPRAGNSRMERALAGLPIGEPPLPIQQYISTEGKHELVARPNAMDFFCIGGVEARRAAVAAFFAEARKRFVRYGLDDFSLVIASNSSDISQIRPLARVRRGIVTLTPLGHSRRDC
jgi:hypothetical protein